MRTFILSFAFLFLSTLAAEGEKHALLIGVQEYSDPDLPQLQYAENDARELAAVLKLQGYAEANMHLLTVSNAFDTRTDNLRPTAKNIRLWLNYINKNAQPQDTVLIAFAGHGIELKEKDNPKLFRPFYCPLEASLKDEKTLVSVTDLYDALDKECKARVKLLVMDACRTSRFSRDASVTAPLIPDPPGGIVAFFSCGKGQKSYESDTFKHGIFFHYFIAGLKGAAAGADGEVTVPLLEHYLTREVPRMVVKEQKNPEAEQFPERRGQLLGEVVLAKIAAVVKAPVAAMTAEELEKIREETRKAVREEELAKIRKESATAVKTEKEDDKTLTLDLGNNLKMEFVKIPAGSFEMGSAEDESERILNEKQHRVTISKAFYMGKYHVTVGQFREFVRAENYKTDAERGTPRYENGKKGAYIRQNGKFEFSENGSWKNPGFEQGEDEPVVCVSWNDTHKYVEWLSQKSGKQVRLPTEAEWEYACRAGTTTPFNTGSTLSTEQANYDGNYTYGGGVKGLYRGKTMRVGSFKPNAFGLFDMHGNAWQWCTELNHINAEILNDMEARILRGGSWDTYPRDCRSAYRFIDNPTERYPIFGFRVVVLD